MKKTRAAIVGLILLALALPAAAGAQTPDRGAQSVFPGDARVQVTNVGAYPWRAIVYLEDRTFFGLLPDGGWCSGAFVGPDVVLTAAHCLYSPTHGWVTSIRAVPGKNGSAEPWGSQFVSRSVVPAQWIATGSPEYDYGIAVMPDPGLGSRVGWFQMGALSDATLTAPGFAAALTAYPGDKPSGTLWHEARSGLAGVGPTQLYYWLSMRPGASGGAVWRPSDQTIVAINTYEFLASTAPKIPDPTRPNFGRRVDAAMVGSVTAWCAQYGCTPAAFVESASPPTPIPTAPPTATPIPTATAKPTSVATSTPTPVATSSPTPTNSPTAVPSATGVPTQPPAATATRVPPTATAQPTETPTPVRPAGGRVRVLLPAAIR